MKHCFIFNLIPNRKIQNQFLKKYHLEKEEDALKLPETTSIDKMWKAVMLEEIETEKQNAAFSKDVEINFETEEGMYWFHIDKCPDKPAYLNIKIDKKHEYQVQEYNEVNKIIRFIAPGGVISKGKHWLEFKHNRFFFNACYDTLKLIPTRKIDITAFQSPPSHHRNLYEENVGNLTWANKKIAMNEEQKLAIYNMLNSKSSPKPFICFGPPGTGKTSTLVEVVVQLVKEKFRPRKTILICAQSNACCDDISKKLLQYLSDQKILRFYSSSMERKVLELNEEVVSNSNLRGNKLNELSVEELHHFQIIITTLASSKKLQLANLEEGHFTHILIDECGSATEVASLIPIVCLGTNQAGEFTAKFFLFGDHMQLGPVVQTEGARNLGFGNF